MLESSEKHQVKIVAIFLVVLSLADFWYYFHTGLTLAYSDAQSHLNIARRVIDSLTPGLAQIGSIWLPLPHILMLLTVWSDTMWHTGLSGSLVSMIAFVVSGVLVFKILRELGVGAIGRVIGVLVFALDPNVLYLQSTAMTELLLLVTMMASVYAFLLWRKYGDDMSLVKASFWVMLATLIRYEGWFLLVSEAALVFALGMRQGWKKAEGRFLIFCFLGGFGIFLWLLWNWAIFGDPLYFAFGQFSAHTQQENFSVNGLLLTEHNWLLSTKIYSIAVMLSAGWPAIALASVGIALAFIRKQEANISKVVMFLLVTPFFFNILSLYLGHSILFMPHILGSGWFNVRYGVMCVPAIAIGIALVVNSGNRFFRLLFAGVVLVALAFAFSYEPVTLQDAKEGMARKDLRAIGRWLSENAPNPDEKILISAAANDPVVFLSGFPMKRFIYEGSGAYWKESVERPDKYATWVFVDKKNSMDFIATHVRDAGKLDQKFENVHEDEWFVVYRVRHTVGSSAPKEE